MRFGREGQLLSCSGCLSLSPLPVLAVLGVPCPAIPRSPLDAAVRAERTAGACGHRRGSRLGSASSSLALRNKW